MLILYKLTFASYQELNIFIPTVNIEAIFCWKKLTKIILKNYFF